MGNAKDMGSYEEQRESMEADYGDEVMYAGWIPAIALMCLLQPFVSTHKLTTIPSDLATVNADLFMQRMYAYQR